MKGKTAILVGPASTMDGSCLGEFIDSHDVVCRVGDVFPIPIEYHADLGTRTDILYENFMSFREYDSEVPILPKVDHEAVANAWSEAGIMEIRSVYGHHQGWHVFMELNNGRFNVVDVSPNSAEEMVKGRVPTKGFIAIVDFLSQGWDNPGLCGFTFGKDYCRAAAENPLLEYTRNPEFLSPTPWNRDHLPGHNQNIELEVFRKIVPDGIWMDEKLKELAAT